MSRHSERGSAYLTAETQRTALYPRCVPPPPELAVLADRVRSGFLAASLREQYAREGHLTSSIVAGLRGAGIAEVTRKPEKVYGPLGPLKPCFAPDLAAYGVRSHEERIGAIAIELKLLRGHAKNDRVELMRGYCQCVVYTQKYVGAALLVVRQGKRARTRSVVGAGVAEGPLFVSTSQLCLDHDDCEFCGAALSEAIRDAHADSCSTGGGWIWCFERFI